MMIATTYPGRKPATAAQAALRSQGAAAFQHQAVTVLLAEFWSPQQQRCSVWGALMLEQKAEALGLDATSVFV